MTDEVVRLTEMERRLAGDTDGSYRDTVCRSLNDQILEVKRQLDAGLPPAEFDQMSKLMAGLQSALSVVETVWSLEHENRR